jgi:hypothetical protein
VSEDLQEITTFLPAYDKRDPDPKKDYGIHSVELRMVLKGPEGAVQFVVLTNWQLPHVAKETERRALLGKLTDSLMGCLFNPLPADLGYHSRKQMYEGQLPMGAEKFDFDQKEILKGATGDIEIPTRVATGTFTPCEYVDGGPCYYDGSTLNAGRVFDVLLREGSAGVWRELRKFYTETFRRAE